ncbi:biotin operon repressor, partial [Neisseria sp. HSC-16F19]
MMLMAKAMSLKVGNSVRKLVLLKLADQANDKGECWPSYQSIAEAAECSRKTAIEHIDWLAAKGYLKIEKRAIGKGQNLTNVYRLTLENGGEAATPPSVTATPPSVTATPPSVTATPPSVTATP